MGINLFQVAAQKHGLAPGEDSEHHVVLCVGIGALGLPYGGAPAQGMGNIWLVNILPQRRLSDVLTASKRTV